MLWAVCRLTFGIISCMIALGALALSFATDQWIHCQVNYGNSETWSSTPLYNCTYCPELFFTRNRGLFRTCYPGSSADWVKAYPYLESSMVDSVCLAERGYDVCSGDPSADSPYYRPWRDYYQMRIHMMRSHWALFVVALAVLLVSSFLGTVGCWKLKANLTIATTVLLLIAALSVMVGMILFHQYYYLEQYKIIQAPLIGLVLQNSSYTNLRTATSCSFGFSYAFGWVSLATCTIAFILFLSVAVSHCVDSRPSLPQKTEEQLPPKQPQQLQQPNNPAYMFFDGVLHRPDEPKSYPIPFDPYDLHLPTGISSNVLKLPTYSPSHGKLDVPMLHPKLPVNY